MIIYLLVKAIEKLDAFLKILINMKILYFTQTSQYRKDRMKKEKEKQLFGIPEKLSISCFLSFLPMSHNDAIDFENTIDSNQPLRSEVVARWQRKIQDKSHRQGTVV